MLKREKLHQGKKAEHLRGDKPCGYRTRDAQADAALGQFGRLWMETNSSVDPLAQTIPIFTKSPVKDLYDNPEAGEYIRCKA